MKRRIRSFTLVFALCLSLVHPALAAEARHDMGTGDLILDGRSCANGCAGHRVTGSTNANRILIRGGRHTVILDGVNVETQKIPFEISGGAMVELELKGSNRLAAKTEGSGLCVSGAELTVKGNGSLSVYGGDCYVGTGGIYIENGKATIAGGDIEAQGKGTGSGIGGDGMELTITGGSVRAKGEQGAGIGKTRGPAPMSNPDRLGTIRISGGRVSAESENGIGLGTTIPGAALDIIITGGTVEARGEYGLGGVPDGEAGWVMAPNVVTAGANNRVYIDNADVTAVGKYCALYARKLQITGGAHVEAECTNSDRGENVAIRALDIGIYDSKVKTVNTGKDYPTSIDLFESEYEDKEDTPEDIAARGGKSMELMWDGVDLRSRLVVVNSTLDTHGNIAKGTSRYGGTVEFWNSTVTAGSIGTTVGLDIPFMDIGIHGGKVTSRGGIIGEVTIYDGTVDSTGSFMGIGPHVTIFDGEVTSQGGYESNGGGVGLGGVRIEDVRVMRNGKWVHEDLLWPGRVVICGGKVTALGGFEGSYAWAGGGPGIGGCGDTDGGYVAIYGGEVLAKGSMGPDQSPEAREEMSHWGGNLNAWGEVACNAAGIGGASEEDGGEIYIAGGTVTAVGGGFAAGIGGGGSKGNGGQIVISGGEVTAYGGRSAAAIGGGWASLKPDAGRTGEVYIIGGDVTAIGYEGTGTGIGNGRTSKPSDSVPSRIVITGGSVKATGGKWSAGIGGTGGSNYGLADRSGYDDPDDPLSWGGSDGGEILIGGDAYVEATGGPGVWGIGGGIPDDSSSNWNPGKAPRLTILEGAEVKATKQCVPSTRGSIPDVPQVPDAPEPDEGDKPEPEELPEEAKSLSFEDVSPYAWYADAVQYALEKELFNGTDAAHFSPDSPMTRAMLVTVLHRAEGKPPHRGTASFEDVPQGQWYTDAVLWAAERGIVNGRGNGLFDPQQDITRQELAVVLYNKAGSPKSKVGSLSSNSDGGEIPTWARDAVGWMTKNGLWVYQDQKELKGGQKATRAEVAAVLQAVLEK